MKTIVGAVIESVKNLKDVIILTCFSLSVFALLGLQLYIGALTQICIQNGPSNMTNTEWFNWHSNKSNWVINAADDQHKNLCSNSTGGQTCKNSSTTCMAGFYPNPNYGYTNFDSFNWALLSAFRLMTQDAWENLYQQILRATGPYHILFFMAAIFLGSIYLINLILAIVAMSYDDLQRKNNEEEQQAEAEEEAYLQSKRQAEHDEQMLNIKEANSTYNNSCESMDCSLYSTSGVACRQRNLLHRALSHNENDCRIVGNRKDSFSLPGSPFKMERYTANDKTVNHNNTSKHTLDHHHYSSAETDLYRQNGENAVHNYNYLRSRYSNYTSNASRISYSSHGDIYNKGSPTIKNNGLMSLQNLHGYYTHKDVFDIDDYLMPRKRRQSVNPFLEKMSHIEEDNLNAGNAHNHEMDLITCDDRAHHIAEEEEAESNEEPLKTKVINFCKRAIDILCIWDCCWCWIRLQELFALIVFDPFMELFITLCIVVNTLFMALDHHDMDPAFSTFLDNGNTFFTTTFAIEAFLKLIALNPKFYFREGWNCFDFFIVALSLLEKAVEGVGGFSVLRTFRLVNGKVPRWNFTDFLHSFMIVFRVLCGEWIESMWDCMFVAGPICVPFFLATVIIAANLSAPTAESADTKKLQEAFERFARAQKWIKNRIIAMFKIFAIKTESILCQFFTKPRNRISDQALKNGINVKEANENQIPKLTLEEETDLDITASGDIDEITLQQKKKFQNSALTVMNSIRASNAMKPIEEEKNALQPNATAEQKGDAGSEAISATGAEMCVAIGLEAGEEPADCFSESFYKRFPCCLEETPFWMRWKKLRSKCFHLVENKYFETLVITLILISSLTLALEDVYLPERLWLKNILEFTDKFFTVIFFFEMILKWFAYGFQYYFTNAWCWLDFIIVMVSVLNFCAELLQMNKIQAFKTMRTLRALRPLRAMSRMQGMRVVVNALVQAIPAIFNFFSGKFFYCRDRKTHEIVNATIVPNKTVCESMPQEYEWYNPPINFDNVLHAYLSLFQVATWKGWHPIMNHAVDSRKEALDLQPIYETNINMYLYFVLFIILGSFFTLNLFIGVIIDNFNEQKKKTGASLELFMTEEQKKYYKAMKKMGKRKPIKAIPRPRMKLQAILFDITTNKKFDMTIMAFILLNMFVMCLDKFQAPQLYTLVLERLNLFFIAVFTAECVLKMFALRWYYFKEPWNVFDFVIVILSIAGSVLKEWISRYFVSPTLLRVVRVVKVGRVLRLVKSARGIRTLLFALAMSLPALFNICLLLFLVIFIYAIFGMSFFMNVKYKAGVDETFNFGTFFKSFILLFQMCTSAGWAEVLEAIMNEEDCEKDTEERVGNCGNKGVAIAYLVSYLLITFLVIINMYIAVILENYSQATEDVNEGLTDDDYDMYYEIWQRFDPKGTQFIHVSQLSDLFDALEYPLQIPKPNKYKIVIMDIPICKGDMCYCVDILDELTKDFFARKGHVIEETQELAEVVPKRAELEHVSSTLWRQRQETCAIVIQRAWRKMKNANQKENVELKL
ncbi:uncharacterized protein B4U79_11701, partial [Dinothrombium tinctorium]